MSKFAEISRSKNLLHIAAQRIAIIILLPRVNPYVCKKYFISQGDILLITQFSVIDLEPVIFWRFRFESGDF